MKHIHDIIRTRLESRLVTNQPVASSVGLAKLDQLVETEWSPEFEQLMRNRLLMGALRYGTLADKRAHKTKWKLIEALSSKIKCYEQTGNTEYLVDAANYCLLAFECDDHPTKHFKALDDHHDHCKQK